MKSRIESEEPKRVIPKTDIQLPILAKPRKDRVEPKLMKSRRETEDPSRDIPKTDRDEPKRANDRNDNVEPRVA